MTAPAALQRYADLVVKGKYKDIDKLWTIVQVKNKSVANKLEKLGSNAWRLPMTVLKSHPTIAGIAICPKNPCHVSTMHAVEICPFPTCS